MNEEYHAVVRAMLYGQGCTCSPEISRELVVDDEDGLEIYEVTVVHDDECRMLVLRQAPFN